MKRRPTPATLDLAAFRFSPDVRPARAARRRLAPAGLVLLAAAVLGAAALQGAFGAAG